MKLKKGDLVRWIDKATKEEHTIIPYGAIGVVLSEPYQQETTLLGLRQRVDVYFPSMKEQLAPIVDYLEKLNKDEA